MMQLSTDWPCLGRITTTAMRIRLWWMWIRFDWIRVYKVE